MPEYTIEGGAPKRSTRWTIYRDGEALATVYDRRDATMLVDLLKPHDTSLDYFAQLKAEADQEAPVPPDPAPRYSYTAAPGLASWEVKATIYDPQGTIYCYCPNEASAIRITALLNADPEPEPAAPPPLAQIRNAIDHSIQLGPAVLLWAEDDRRATQATKIINILADAVRALRTCEGEIMRITVAEQMDAELRVVGIPEDYLR